MARINGTSGIGQVLVGLRNGSIDRGVVKKAEWKHSETQSQELIGHP